jgi:hypothetical protein
MPGTKQDKRVFVDVRKMDEPELDAAIDSALDELFGSDDKSQEKQPARRRKRPPAPNQLPSEHVVGMLRSLNLGRADNMTEEQRIETRQAFQKKIGNVKKGATPPDKE